MKALILDTHGTIELLTNFSLKKFTEKFLFDKNEPSRFRLQNVFFIQSEKNDLTNGFVQILTDIL